MGALPITSRPIIYGLAGVVIGIVVMLLMQSSCSRSAQSVSIRYVKRLVQLPPVVIRDTVTRRVIARSKPAPLGSPEDPLKDSLVMAIITQRDSLANLLCLMGISVLRVHESVTASGDSVLAQFDELKPSILLSWKPAARSVEIPETTATSVQRLGVGVMAGVAIDPVTYAVRPAVGVGVCYLFYP